MRPGRSGALEIRADPLVSAGATRRSYRVHVPAGYRPGRAVPAVLLLHGNGGSAADLLDDLQARLCVDPARVAAAGFSAGGGVVAGMACDLAGRVASVAVVSGALYAEPGECRPSRPVPVLAIHGTDDPVVPYGGRSPSVEWPLPMPPMPAWLATWATRDGCPGDPAVFLDTPEATAVRRSGCRDGSEVVHYRMNGGGHHAPRTIAGRSFAQVAWDFFAAHPLPG